MNDSRHFQLAIYIYIYTQFFMQNPNLQSEFSNSFTLRRSLRKINTRESRFLIVKILITCLHRSWRVQTWEYDYIRSFSRGIRFFRSQDIILSSKPSLLGKACPIIFYFVDCYFLTHFLFSFFFWTLTDLRLQVVSESSGRVVGQNLL